MTLLKHLIRMKKRSLVRHLSFLLAMMVALTSAAVYGYGVAVRYRTQLEYTYQKALQDLGDGLSVINARLKKELHNGSAEIAKERLWISEIRGHTDFKDKFFSFKTDN